MKNRKYNINNTPLSNAEIDQFKDFDGILNKIKGNPGPETNIPGKNLLKYGKGLIVVAGVAIIALLTAKLLTKKDKTSEAAATQEIPVIKAAITAPFPAEDLPYDSFLINAQRDTTIFSKKGAEIAIKANTFNTANGQLATGAITIKFREFHNPIDIFRAGVPMQYDSAGTAYTFESQGMFELSAFQNGDELQEELSKKIAVSLICETGKPGFNEYYFNETAGEWEYLDECVLIPKEQTLAKLAIPSKTVTKDTMIIQSDASSTSNAIVSVMDRTAPQKPKYPKVLKDKYSFTINFDKKEFPELDPNVVFQVDESLSKFSAAYFNANWDKIELKRSNIVNRYKVLLTKGDELMEVEAYPALSPEMYDKLELQYQMALKNYEKQQADLEKQRAMSNTRTTTPITAAEIANSKLLNARKTQLNTGSKNNYTWKIEIARAGTYNCDQPIPPSRLIKVYNGETAPVITPTFSINTQPIVPEKRYNVVNGVNMLMNPDETDKLAYSNTAKNVMWVIVDDKIAIANAADFNKIGRVAVFNFELKAYEPKQALTILEEMLAVTSE